MKVNRYKTVHKESFYASPKSLKDAIALDHGDFDVEFDSTTGLYVAIGTNSSYDYAYDQDEDKCRMLANLKIENE